MKLNQLTVPVRDVPRAINFYQQLGFQLIVHTHDNYARFLCPDRETTFSVHRVDKLAEGEGIWLYFECEKLDEQPEDKVWRWREARLKDPDGNQLIL